MENPELNENIKEINEVELKDVRNEIPVKVKKILKGKLEDLIMMVKDPNQMRQKGLDWLGRQGKEPYILLITEDKDGVERKFLVHESYAPSSMLYRLLKKYGKLAKGMEIMIRYDPESLRFKIVTD